MTLYSTLLIASDKTRSENDMKCNIIFAKHNLAEKSLLKSCTEEKILFPTKFGEEREQVPLQTFLLKTLEAFPVVHD